jgi:predicted dienelactone hydrolase
MTAGASGATLGSAGTAGMTVATAGKAGTAAGGVGGGAGGAGVGHSNRPLASTLKLPTMMEAHPVAPFFNIWRPTDITKIDGKLPIFVWNNGACSRNDAVFKPLFDKWASGGWIVLSLTSGGGASSTTQDDHKGLVDWVFAEADKAGSPYNGKLDLDHITAGGNSCGGITALGLAAADKRVTGIWVLSGSSGMGGANTMVTNAIKIPVAFMCGGTDDIARANLEADYAAFGAGIPAMMVERSTGDHLTLSNLSGDIAGQAAEVSLNWLDLTTYGQKGALDALNSPTVCTGCMSGLWKMTSKNLESLVK